MKEAVVTVNIFVPTGDIRISEAHKSTADIVRLENIDNDVDEIARKMKREIHKIKEQLEE